MHSSVYQITTEKIIEGGLLDEDTLHQGDCSGLDYCSNIDDEERKERIENLVNNILPEGMFTLIDENTIRYNGGVEIWQEEWVKQIKEKCAVVTANNIQEWRTLYYLQEAIENPLDVGSRFYGDNCGYSSFSEKSGEFMKSLNELEAGTLLRVDSINV